MVTALYYGGIWIPEFYPTNSEKQATISSVAVMLRQAACDTFLSLRFLVFLCTSY
jgi:hypothetical protein